MNIKIISNKRINPYFEYVESENNQYGINKYLFSFLSPRRREESFSTRKDFQLEVLLNSLSLKTHYFYCLSFEALKSSFIIEFYLANYFFLNEQSDTKLFF